jgi:ribosome-associated protein
MTASRRRSDEPNVPGRAGETSIPGRSAEANVPGRSGLPARAPLERASSEDGERAALELARRVVDLAADKKASDIVLLGVRELTTMADYFVICSGASERQLGAIADGIVQGLRAEGVRPIGSEGAPGAHWLLLDFGAVIVHVFAPPERDYYQLEKLWAEAPTILRVL